MNFLSVLLIIGLSLFLSACANSASYEGNHEFQMAKSGNVDAQYNVAMNFLNGDEGFPKDYLQAKKWFKLASEQGDSSAQNALGIIYLRGFDGKNLGKSEYYYRLAANQNHENAQLQLALILLTKKENIKEAIYWLEKASAQGNVEAKEKLLELRK